MCFRNNVQMATFRSNMQMVNCRNDRRWTGLIQQRIGGQVGAKRDGCYCDERKSKNNECRQS